MSESEAVERNRKAHEEALRRASVRNSGQPSTSGIESPKSAQDAILNWSGGQQVATIGHSDIPLSSELSRVSGVGTGSPGPDPGSSYPHGASGMDEICNGGGRE